MHWHTPIQYVSMVGPVYAKRLEKLNIFTAGDLLTHLPFRYEDFSKIYPINKLVSDKYCSVVGEIMDARNIYTRSSKTIQKVKITDGTSEIEALWFNQPFLIKNLVVGQKIAVSGKPVADKWKLVFQSPEYEIVRDHKPLIHTARLVPIYPETAGVSSKWLRSRIYPLLSAELTREFLPDFLLTKYQLVGLQNALNNIHFPDDVKNIAISRRRLAYDELLSLQLLARIHRQQWQNRHLSQALSVDEEKIFTFIQGLPFILTAAQKKVVRQILEDLGKTTPMNRLIEGDVGSGKTVVATIAMYTVFLNSCKSLLMAPTQILAQQHFATLTRFLNTFGVKVGLVTSASPLAKNKQQLNVDVLVGTHALLEKKIQMDKVKLIIIDEQHRFGVKQRALIRQKGSAPHVLTMTATPIPRTVALTLYNDLDLSVIDQMPKGRKIIKTWVVPPQKRQAAYAWINKQIQNNKDKLKAFIICPFIDISESLQSVKAATHEYEKLQTAVFPDLKLALLHGRLKSNIKNQILDDFRSGKTDILVSTPVVEVGIDIPQANIMIIEAAERFGLAQLHQLRGRIGRTDQQAYCLLFTTPGQEDAVLRLKQLEKVSAGIELAEIDLKTRGPGQIFGLDQHGHHGLKIASYTDLPLIEAAQSSATQLVQINPGLDGFPYLKERILSGKIENIVPD